MEFLFLGFEGAGLADQAFAEGRVAGEPFIVFGDLLAQVFLFHVEQGFRVLAFQTADEESEEAFDEVADTFEHGEQYGAG